jgi:hypothetical protein
LKKPLPSLRSQRFTSFFLSRIFIAVVLTEPYHPHSVHQSSRSSLWGWSSRCHSYVLKILFLIPLNILSSIVKLNLFN